MNTALIQSLQKQFPVLPVPGFVDPRRVGELYMVDYDAVMEAAMDWKARYKVGDSTDARAKVHFVGIDSQITFALKMAQLVVVGALESAVREVEFLYRNAPVITHINRTFDTHEVWQIFHKIFLVDANGKHPTPGIPIADADIQAGKWTINPAVAKALFDNAATYPALQRYLRHYSRILAEPRTEPGIPDFLRTRYPLIPWPFHAMLGGIEHALVPLIHEADFFHSVLRSVRRQNWIKGGKNLSEAYSPLGEEVKIGPDKQVVGQKNAGFIKVLFEADAVIIAGQAKSHCVRNFIADFLIEILAKDRKLAKKVFLVEDLTDPVIIPGVIDFTQQANEAFDAFRQEGMNVVKSTTPILEWPGMAEILDK